MIISLTGFMGCGKSSIGRKLSELLCCSYIDLDDIIAEKAGKSIPEIFREDGEEVFRALEEDTLRNIFCTISQITVLSLGGGTVMRKVCAEMVKDNSLCIYLRASVDTLEHNLKNEVEGRPVLAGHASLRERIKELLNLRSSTYEDTAHIIIDIDGRNVDEAAESIVPYLQ